MSATVFVGDNLTIIRQQIPSKSIDFIYFNPPFGTTEQPWDDVLDWKALFQEFYRVLKDDGMIAIHCSVPFNYHLIREAPKPPNYSWYWKKENATNHLLASTQPMRNTEEILVWKGKKNRYYPQRIGDEERTNSYNGSCFYYNTHQTHTTKRVKGRLQTHHIEMARTIDGFSTRPVELIELFLRSYTREGDTILDPTCYKGLCGSIAKRMGRRYIGIDKYFYPERLMN